MRIVDKNNGNLLFEPWLPTNHQTKELIEGYNKAKDYIFQNGVPEEKYDEFLKWKEEASSKGVPDYMLTYDEFMNDQRANGCVVLDSNNYFQLDVTEKDELGEYGGNFFGVDYSVVEGDGEYGMVFAGQFVDGADGDADLVGEFAIMFQYGDMSEPYVMYYSIAFDSCMPY